MTRISSKDVRTLTMAVLAFGLALAAGQPARADVVTYYSEAAFLAAISGATTQTYDGPADGTKIGQGGSLGGLTYTFTAGALSNDPTVGGFGAPFGQISNGFFSFGDPANPHQFSQSLAAGRPNIPNPAPPAFVTADGATAFLPGEKVTVTSGTPLYAVGIYFNGDVPFNSDPTRPNEGTKAGDFYLSVPSLGAAGLVPNILNAVPDPVYGIGNPTLYFIGLTSTTPFTSVDFGAILPNANTLGSSFTLDNLTTAPALPAGAVPEPATLLVFGGLAAAGLGLRRRRTS